MKSVTQRLLAFVAMLFVSLPVWAQTNVNVTFQADLRPAVTNCQFNTTTGKVFIRGSFNSWGSGVEMTDTDGDRVYSTTMAVPSGTAINYKFTAPIMDGWENDPNRSYTPTTDANQTVAPEVPRINGFDTNGCTAVNRNYEVQFDLDVSTMSATVFNPLRDTVFVAGSFNGWGDSKDRLIQDITNGDLYSTTINMDAVPTPSDRFFKFIVRKANAPGVTGRGPISWESPRNSNPDNNRKLSFLTADTDANGNGRFDLRFGPVYWSDVPPTEVLSAAKTVTFEIDMTPAIQYAAANGGLLPGGTVAFANTVFLNGPGAQAADGLTDWAAWNMDGLGAMATRRFHDDATNGGDQVANDRIYTQTFTFPRGTALDIKGKFGADAGDNESGFAADRVINIGTVANGGRIRMVFGAIRFLDGKHTDLRGPGAFPKAYDPWICIPSDSLSATSSTTPSCPSVVSSEPVEAPAVSRFTVESVYPNPTTGASRLRYALPSAMAVKVEVYDLLGRQIETVVDETQAAGTYNAVFSGRALSPGVYVYRISAGGQVQNRTFVVSQ